MFFVFVKYIYTHCTKFRKDRKVLISRKQKPFINLRTHITCYITYISIECLAKCLRQKLLIVPTIILPFFILPITPFLFRLAMCSGKRYLFLNLPGNQ